MKACSNLAILKVFANLGGGVDIVSGGELYRALKAGVDPQKIVYSGVGKKESEIDEALDQILSTMGGLVSPRTPRVPNPVNPAEDFADKWGDPKYSHLRLEYNFNLWLEQAKADFRTLTNARTPDLIVEQAEMKLGISLGRKGLEEKLGLGAPSLAVAPKSHAIVEPAKPWCQNG